jgi:hypothetical protein
MRQMNAPDLIRRSAIHVPCWKEGMVHGCLKAGCAVAIALQVQGVRIKKPPH